MWLMKQGVQGEEQGWQGSCALDCKHWKVQQCLCWSQRHSGEPPGICRQERGGDLTVDVVCHCLCHGGCTIHQWKPPEHLCAWCVVCCLQSFLWFVNSVSWLILVSCAQGWLTLLSRTTAWLEVMISRVDRPRWSLFWLISLLVLELRYKYQPNLIPLLY